MSEKQITISVVKGGYILSTYGFEDTEGNALAATNGQTEVFSSEGKLIKAVRGLIGDEKPAKAADTQA